MRAAALTISTSRAAGDGREDASGPRLAELARALGASEVKSELLADERPRIETRLRELCDDERCALVLTSGGTGLAADDVTPEATLAVLEREVPGIAEAMRMASREHTSNWMLSRAVAGVRGSTLIVNLPGSPRAIEQVAEALRPGLQHALALLASSQTPH